MYVTTMCIYLVSLTQKHIVIHICILQPFFPTTTSSHPAAVEEPPPYYTPAFIVLVLYMYCSTAVVSLFPQSSKVLSSLVVTVDSVSMHIHYHLFL